MLRLSKNAGFTLIELLIVVAIIAILAAIAVPNFLEAQTRSKVSRVHSDLRSLTTAIESYYVDHNNYVLPSYEDGEYTGWTGKGSDDYGGFFHMLSTPVAYMANPYIVDPFSKSEHKDTPAEFVRYHGFSRDMITGYLTSPTETDEPDTYGDLSDEATALDNVQWWILWSVGPDVKVAQVGDPLADWYTHFGKITQVDLDEGDVPDIVYDSTNGSLSSGELFRIGGGIASNSFADDEDGSGVPEFQSLLLNALGE